MGYREYFTLECFRPQRAQSSQDHRPHTNPREWVYKVKYELSNGAEISPNVLAHQEDLSKPKGVEEKYHAKVNRKPKLKTWAERGKKVKSEREVKPKIDLNAQMELLNSI